MDQSGDVSSARRAPCRGGIGPVNNKKEKTPLRRMVIALNEAAKKKSTLVEFAQQQLQVPLSHNDDCHSPAGMPVEGLADHRGHQVRQALQSELFGSSAGTARVLPMADQDLHGELGREELRCATRPPGALADEPAEPQGEHEGLSGPGTNLPGHLGGSRPLEECDQDGDRSISDIFRLRVGSQLPDDDHPEHDPEPRNLVGDLNEEMIQLKQERPRKEVKEEGPSFSMVGK